MHSLYLSHRQPLPTQCPTYITPKIVKRACLQKEPFFAFFAVNGCKQGCLQGYLHLQTLVDQIVKCCLQDFGKQEYMFTNVVQYCLFYQCTLAGLGNGSQFTEICPNFGGSLKCGAKFPRERGKIKRTYKNRCGSRRIFIFNGYNGCLILSQFVCLK